MKARLYTNCSLVRVPITAGETEYYLPQNVEWSGKKIDRMVICAPQTACTDPIDGVTPVMLVSDLADMYVNLYDKDNAELMHDVSFEQLLHTNNNTIDIDAVLNISLCKLYFTQAPAADATLLLYVFYETRVEEDYEASKRTVTVDVPLQADQQISFRDIIDYYVHELPGTICGMIVWNAVNHPVWITLRDHDLTYQMANIHSEMARPDMNGGTAMDSQAELFLMNDLNIDFDYSNIREASGNASEVKITFMYK